MKASGPPCPFDQIPIICFKRCSILRSSELEICKEVLRRKSIPKSWERAATILIYKKSDKSDPSNFRPITLGTVILKILTLLIRDRVFKLLHKNKYRKFYRERVQTRFKWYFWTCSQHITHHKWCTSQTTFCYHYIDWSTKRFWWSPS